MAREKRWRRLRKRGFVDSDGGTRGMSTKAVVSTKTVLWVEMEVMAAVRGWTWKWTWKGNEKGQWKVKVVGWDVWIYCTGMCGSGRGVAEGGGIFN